MFKAGDDFAHHPIALAITKKSKDLKRLMDPVIAQLKNSNFVEKLKARYWYSTKRRESCPEYRVLSNGLSLFNTYGIFLILPIGLSASIVIVSIENWLITLWHKKAAQKRRLSLVAVTSFKKG